MVLGDFNLDRIGDPQYDAFIETGLWPPAELNEVPRTIFDDDKDRNFYDRTAWFSQPGGTSLLEDITYNERAGSFDFLPHITTGLTLNEISWRISDPYPRWAEFTIPGVVRIDAGNPPSTRFGLRRPGEDHPGHFRSLRKLLAVPSQVPALLPQARWRRFCSVRCCETGIRGAAD
jgi:hypothetical protein